jgi:hypothetical protein
VAAVAVAWVATRRPLAVEGPAPPDGATRWRGAVHVHTSLSDGGGTPEDVAPEARAAGLDFVVITDHNNLEAKPFEGYRDGVLVLVGTEVSTASSGHVVGLGLREDPAFRFSGDPSDALDDVRFLGGSSFAAHPFSPRADFRWTAWDLPGPWGLELINGDSQWRAAGRARLLKAAVLYPLNPRHALLGALSPSRETLDRWDALLAERAVPGIAGADAHARLEMRKGWSLPFPSYRSVLGLAVNHVLLASPPTRDAKHDGAMVADALARGRSYVGLDALAPAAGFFFVAENGEARVTMGDTIAPAPGLRLRAGGRMPKGARLRLLRDGRTVAEAAGAIDASGSEPGVYRVEVSVDGWPVPWVLTNPIYVFDGAAAAEERRLRAAWPEPVDAPAPAVMIDGFEGETAFVAASDPASSIERPPLQAGTGVAGGGAGRLRFRLGQPTAERPDVYCALVDYAPPDLRGRQGLVFAIKADGAYRVWVQVRDANPASRDEGTEWWFASVRTLPEWRRVAIPFSRLRSINPATDGRLDLDTVKALVFVLDKGSVDPGTAGTIWLDDLGAY